MIKDRNIPCPSAESIRHYAAGGFDDEHAELLEEHLLSCPHCETLLDGLDDPSDAVIRALTTLPMSADDEAAYQQMRQSVLSQTEEFVGSADSHEKLQLAHRLADPDLGPLPFKLGGYELLACIGRGASGAVYRARHLKLEQIVAVKVLDASRSIDPDSFLQEMKTIGSLAHPNIVRATDAGEADGYHYLVMEYVDGIDASRLLFRNGPLDVADACEIVRQAALGLQFVHDQSLIHRDIKPSNLLVTVEGQVKLLDLGIAMRLDETRPDLNGHARPQGTYDYMAPEVWNRPASIDSRSDLYSLGCTLYKLITSKVASQDSEKIAECPTHVPRAVQKLLQKLLAKDPRNRPASMQAVIDTLEPASRGANLPALIGKTSPQLATLIRPKATNPDRRLEQFTNRRTAIIGVASLAALAFLVPKIKNRFYPRLERVIWRPLEPVEPKLFLAAGDLSANQIASAPSHEFNVTTDRMTLVNMGRPVNGLFSIATELSIQEAQSNGLFFRGQIDYSRPHRTLKFQSVELAKAVEEQSQQLQYYLVWSERRSEERNGTIEIQQTPLAEVAVTLATEKDFQSLQVTCGQAGMPGVLWNGKPIHQSQWNLSAEGHALQRLSTSLLPTAFLGRIGLICVQGTTNFRKPRLAYL